MNYLSVETLAKSYDERVLFSSLTFGLDQGQKVALVGVNGCGKSTLLNIISGLEVPDKGVVSFRKGLRLAILPQNPSFNEEDTVVQAVFAEDIEELNVIRDYELALHHMALHPEQLIDLSPMIESMDRLHAWDYESSVQQILGQLGLYDLEQKIKELSGGQRKRVALARALITSPDFLILDEPTNHLDLEIIEWLEDYLATANLTLLMVTHDRYFLDKVTNEIMEIDRGELYRYKGNYQQFLEKKAEREAQDAASVDKARNLLRKELDWMRRQPKARGTKAKYRVDAFYETQEKASRQVAKSEMEVNLRGERQGKKILELKEVSIGYGAKKMLDSFSYTFQRKERIGIVGPNGVGKSTFLGILTGATAPDSGVRESGQTTKFGFYTQEEQIFDPSKRVLDIVQEVAEVIKLSNGSEVTASQLLNQFLFPPKMQFNLVGKLSGGEKRRLQLLRVLMQNPNFLLLDEPTNDLDLMTLNVLEDYLDSFDGCLVIVSHDRYFMDRLTDHLFVFEGNGIIRDFPGNYTDFRVSGFMQKEEKSIPPPPSSKEPLKPAEKKKLSFTEKKELEQLTLEISNLEKKKANLTTRMQAETTYDTIQKVADDLQQVVGSLTAKEMRWLELMDKE